MSCPKVSIIILNWNGWKNTIECLESLYHINYSNFEVIVVDNASEDDSILKIKEYAEGSLPIESIFFDYDPFNKPIEVLEYDKKSKLNRTYFHPQTSNSLILIKNDFNAGYAEGNNVGIVFALENFDPEYILLLNNDTIVDKVFLTNLVGCAENKPVVGILGPKIYQYNQMNKLQVTTVKINFWTGTPNLIGYGEIDQGQYDVVSNTDYVPGSCFLIKRDVVNKIGLLNSNYYLYWEESDYCMKTKKIGYECVYCPNSRIWHKISESTKEISGLETYYMTRNMFWFMKEHSDNLHLFIFFLFFFGFKFWRVTINFILRNSYYDILCYVKGVKEGIKKNAAI